eukprot:Gregarina_sp_Poly_1__3434@NODE_199_length_11565_cov_209_900244_g178_i0_p4_GENE_NODE_199_length_11565_cov_209_900244_g178_i0NODE_199_length_11565_cov_209_900244_g178_i0_p4_ORF_typecomplete_len569_score55_65Actin/PF00022_19/3_4e54MreB_Mbl/PF06723_13/1_6e03MreB_Mbl/PF06723_13/5e03MreB_Mbl/PF06723_13/0_023Actin_micro/PF17003_5/0_052_NODE_199_length_11565_cov_209_900244_g178_i0919510901
MDSILVLPKTKTKKRVQFAEPLKEEPEGHCKREDGTRKNGRSRANKKKIPRQRMTITLSDPYAIVVDIGASKTYWGYSGDAEPRQCHTSAWCRNEKSQEWSPFPSDFLELRRNYVPNWMTHYPKTPEPLRQYVGMDTRSTTQSNESARSSLSGWLNKTVVTRGLQRVNDLLLDADALKDRSVFFTEPTKRSLAQTRALTEISFETFGAGAVSSARKAALSAFALGRLTACVCELGPLSATITPVYEGYTLQKNIQQYAVGGFFLDWMLASMMHLWDNESSSFDLKFIPYSSRHKTTKTFNELSHNSASQTQGESALLDQVHPNYLHFSRARIVEDFKESILTVKESRGHGGGPMPESQRLKASGAIGGRGRGQSGDSHMGEESDDISYELPDGKILYVNEAIATGIPEYLFSPLDASMVRDFLAPYADRLGPLVCKFPGLPTALVSNAFGCDVDLRPTLLQNIVMAGGGATLDGLTERVAADLTRMTHVDVGQRNYLVPGAEQSTSNTTKDVSSFKFKIAARTPYERSFTSWIGGSVLASLSSYDTLWVSRNEWHEVGPNIVERRAVF